MRKLYKNLHSFIHYYFYFLQILNSPFKPFKLKFYLGPTCYGVPYFLPRVWRKQSTKLDGQNIEPKIYAVEKVIGFDFVPLGWKTKWHDSDFRFEYNPGISFVFLKWQFYIKIIPPFDEDHYWTNWLYYNRCTNKEDSKMTRLLQCLKYNPCEWTIDNVPVNSYKHILKKKYLNDSRVKPYLNSIQ